MGYYKRNLLAQKHKQYQDASQFHQRNANLCKYASVFAGATAAVATIASIVVFIESNEDFGIGTASFAALMAMISHGAYNSHKKQEKLAKKYQTKMRNTQRAYIKDRKKQR